jgi:hypothetical protein
LMIAEYMAWCPGWAASYSSCIPMLVLSSFVGRQVSLG